MLVILHNTKFEVRTIALNEDNQRVLQLWGGLLAKHLPDQENKNFNYDKASKEYQAGIGNSFLAWVHFSSW